MKLGQLLRGIHSGRTPNQPRAPRLREIRPGPVPPLRRCRSDVDRLRILLDAEGIVVKNGRSGPQFVRFKRGS